MWKLQSLQRLCIETQKSSSTVFNIDDNTCYKSSESAYYRMKTEVMIWSQE